MGFSVKNKGDWNNTLGFLHRVKKIDTEKILDKYGKLGVEALQVATPKDTGLTAASWDYEVKRTDNGYSLSFYNSNMAEAGMPVAILIQYGHGTSAGTYVRGVDYINPALKPVFDKMADEILREVK